LEFGASSRLSAAAALAPHNYLETVRKRFIYDRFPSTTHGGELTFTDGRANAKWDRIAPGAYAAWFNTEEHEVIPLIGGYRVVLT